MSLKERLSEILSLNLAKNYTAVSYAIMVDGEIWVADTLGTDGTEENKPATNDHTFNVCSISKIFCTVAVMKLVEQGKVDLDTPVYHYLPDFTMLDERYKRITVRHLLNHASGLPGTQWKHFSATHISSAENTEYYQEVYAHLAKSHLKADPGAYSVYCNDGFTLAEMVVAKVSGMPFGQFCQQYITEPIGAHSTRTSTTVNPDYPLIKEKKKVPEYFYLQGCGGFTTNMTDLCKFGNLFLTKNDIISEESKAEMGKYQGVTFLPEDTASIRYGLGWDNVDVQEPQFDLGDHVVMKGGNSFQFTSKLYVIPKYNAVLAISETHDCKIDVGEVGLHMFATAMLEEKGINIYRENKPVPKELAEQFNGTYLVPSMIMNTHFFGSNLTITNDTTDGEHRAVYKDLKFNGSEFVGSDGEKYFFRQHGDDKYFFYTYHGRTIPAAMKAKPYPALNEVWKARIGKRYIPIDYTEQDMVGHEMMNGMRLAELPGIEGVVVCAFSALAGADIYGNFEGCVIPLDDNTATGFLQTPSNGSRDLVDPCFVTIDGIEHCYVSSYLFRDVESIPAYNGENFSSQPYNPGYNSVFKITSEIKELPEVPEGRRLIVLNKDMSMVYDSQVKSDYKPVSEGFISLI